MPEGDVTIGPSVRNEPEWLILRPEERDQPPILLQESLKYRFGNGESSIQMRRFVLSLPEAHS